MTTEVFKNIWTWGVYALIADVLPESSHKDVFDEN